VVVERRGVVVDVVGTSGVVRAVVELNRSKGKERREVERRLQSSV
jgi:hypothetical protein